MTDTLPQLRDDAPGRIGRAPADDPEPRSGRRSRRRSPSRSTARQVTGREGQTILEVCRDNGIEVPDPVLRAQAARLRRLPHVRGRGRGRGRPADQLLARGRAGHGRPDPDAAAAPDPQDQPRADLQRPQRLLPAAVPEQVPQPHRHPGLPEGQHGGQLHRVDAHLQAHHPVPVACSAASARRRARSTAAATRSRRPSPSATATATPATRSSRRRRDGHRRRRCPFEVQAAERAARGGHRLRARPAWPRPTTWPSPATT